jgi:predicted ATPase
MLIVLDCCEHVVDPVTALAEAVLRAARVSILTKSREPLRAKGEWVLRLAPLEVPSGTAPLGADEALSYSAVQLFIERAAVINRFALSDADVPNVLKICRGLDGMPLALELAAFQVDALGTHGLAQGLTHRFDLLTRGRRTALARQQTLRATMDWSYDFLPEVEKVVLRRLAVFRGDFTLEAASSVVGDENIRGFEAIENRCQSLAEITRCNRHRQRNHLLLPARYDARLCARKAERERRDHENQSPPC